MEVHIWLKHKLPEQERLERDVQEFLARGGEIERLEPGARSSDTRTVKQVHERNVRAKMAKNNAMFKKKADEEVSVDETETETDD
jgi:hypothetical protein